MSAIETEVQDGLVPRLDSFHGRDARSYPEYWGRWCEPAAGGFVHKLNLIVFYQFALEMAHAKGVVTGEPSFQTYMKLTAAENWLRTFLTEAAYIPMPDTKAAALNLLKFLEPITSRLITASFERREEPITVDENVRLGQLIENFEREFEHDSREINIFSVANVGTHSTARLLDRADENLSADVRSRLMPEAVADIKAAGRCLAFNLPTAAGFHVLRAVETLIRIYVDRVTCKPHPAKSRNWGAYIKAIRDNNGDAGVANYLQHIKDTYRNPIMHPEVVLSPDDAASLFYASLSAIVQLDAAIQAHAAGSAVASPP